MNNTTIEKKIYCYDWKENYYKYLLHCSLYGPKKTPVKQRMLKKFYWTRIGKTFASKKEKQQSNNNRNREEIQTIDDLTNPTEKEQLAIKAAKRLSELLSTEANKNRSSLRDTEKEPTDISIHPREIWELIKTQRDGILKEIEKKHTPTTELPEETINAFEVNLVRAILESEEEILSLRTDRGPLGALGWVANILRIPKDYFPKKYIITIDFKEKKVYERFIHATGEVEIK